MVEAVRSGESMRSVARRFNVALPTIQRWVKRAEGREINVVD
jgi:transposase